MPMKKPDKNQHIQVAVRCRPLDQNEKKKGSYSVITIDEKNKEVNVKERLPTAPVKTFSFDKVFGYQSKQIEVYNSMVSPAIKEVLMGYNCTIFAYGQTGSGKTFTMEGERSEDENMTWEEDPLCGIVPRAMAQLFQTLESNPDCEFSVRVSFLEIYNEELIDLLGAESVENPRLKIYEDSSKKGSCVIQGLEEVVVHSKNDVYGILERGSARRQTAATLMNAHSSRSHSLFMVTVHIKENSSEGEELLKIGKLNLVDLAGSENIGRSGAVDKRAREAGQINQSLLTLGRVITSLVEHAPHVPYRESKLTRLLQDSLGGRTKTSIIATISPASCNSEETLSTLDYAYRAKNITNRPEINQKLTKRALLKTYNEEIERLRRDLQAARDKNGVYIAMENYEQMQVEIAQKGDTIRELEEQLEMLTDEKNRIDEMFTFTKVELEETRETLGVTQDKLSDTTTKLITTRQDRDENKHLVSKHIKSEAKLHSQATQLLGTVQVSTLDVDGLHSKLDRKRAVEAKNEETQQNFREIFSNSIVTMKSKIQSTSDIQVQSLQSVHDNLDHLLSKRSKEVDQIVKTLNEKTHDLMGALAKEDTRLDSFHKQSQSQLNSFTDLCEKNKDAELSRISSFREQHFLIAMTEVADSLKKHKEALEETSNIYNQQLTAIKSLITHHTKKNLSHVEEHQKLIEQHHTSQIELLEKQEQTNQTQSSIMIDQIEKHSITFMDTFQKMVDDLRQQTLTNKSQMTERIEEIRTHGDHFQTSASTNVNAMKQELENTQTQLIHVSQENNDTLQHNSTQLCTNVDMILQKRGAIQEEVTVFTTKTEEECRVNADHMVDSLKKHGTEQTKNFKTHLENSQQVQKEHQDSIESINNSQLDHQQGMQAALNTEQGSVIDIKENLQKWTQELSIELDERDKQVESLLSSEIVKDIPTGETPKRREFHYPRVLDKTERHSILLEEFRKDYKLNMALDTQMPDDSFTSQQDKASSVAGEETEIHSITSEHDESGDSAVSTASGYSAFSDKNVDKENVMRPPVKKVVKKSTSSLSKPAVKVRSRTPTPNKRSTDNNTPTKSATKRDITPSARSRLPLKSTNN